MYKCIVGLENGTIYEYHVDATSKKHAKNKVYMKLAFDGITGVYKISIEEIEEQN